MVTKGKAGGPKPTGTSVGGAHRTTSAPILVKPQILERATRLCRISPMITTFAPSIVPKCSFIV